MIKYKIEDILANIIAQTQGYKEGIDTHGLDYITLVSLTEFLVNEVSKLKSIILEIPKEYN